MGMRKLASGTVSTLGAMALWAVISGQARAEELLGQPTPGAIEEVRRDSQLVAFMRGEVAA